MKRRGNLAVNCTTTVSSVYSPLCTLVSNNATGFASASLAVPWAASLALIAIALPAFFLLGNVCFAALGVLLSAPAGRVPSNVMMLSSLVRFPLIFISGIFVPLADLPAAARAVSFLSPLTYLVDGLNAAMGQQPVLPPAVDAAALAGFAFAFLLAATVILKRMALKGL